MASLSKKDFAKRDMNFFAEFTANSQQMARYLGYLIFASIIVVGLLVVVTLFMIVSLTLLNNNIAEYDKKFQQPEYVNLASEADRLTKDAQKINEYDYVLSSMKSQVDKESGVSLDIIREIETNVPTNMEILGYDITKNSLTIYGETLTYYSPTEFHNLINKKDFIVDSNITIERIPAEELGGKEDFITNYISATYKFQIEAALAVDYYVTTSYVSDTNAIIQSIETTQVKPFDTFVADNVSSKTIGSDTYTLSSVEVNGILVSEDELTEILANDSYGFSVASDVNVVFYYVPQSETVTSNEEGK